MRRSWIGFVTLLSFFLVQSAVLAADPASSNFQIQGSAFVPAVGEGASSNYGVASVIDPIVGESQSANWNVRSGQPVNASATVVVVTPPTTPPVITGGGAGGGAAEPLPLPATGSSTVPLPTFAYRSPTFASHQMIRGTYPAEATGVWVNGSTNGVSLLANQNWQRDLPLFLGINQVQVQSLDAANLPSSPVVGEIERMLIGDVNRDRRVNDLDLSLFTRAWTKYNVFADFNEDGKVNDIDLSLLASNWGRSY